MRIALVTPYDWAVPGGVQRHVTALNLAFQVAGHQVSIIAACSGRPPRCGSLPANLIRLRGTPLPMPVSGSWVRVTLSPRLYRELKAILLAGCFDVVHVHEPMMPAISMLAVYHAHVYSSTAAVGTFHAYREENVGYEYGRSVIRRLMSRLDGRIVVSEAARGYIAGYFPGDYRLISNGVDLARFGQTDVEPIPRFANSRPKILFVGRLEKRKGFVHLLNAFGRLRQALPRAQLIVCGAYDRKEAAPFIRQARAAGLRGINFVGWQPDDKLARYYRTADVVCVPSTGFESFGLVLVEAMASGRPVVASDIPGYRDVVRDGVEGLLVPPGDEPALAQALQALLSDPERRQQFGRNGQIRSQDFTWERVAGQVLTYYQELLTTRGESACPSLNKKLAI